MARHRDLGRRSPGADSLARLANLMERGLVDVGDVAYPVHLVNGRPPESPYTVRARRGQRVRLRLANIAGDTHYCVFVEGHELQITHADRSPVRPVSTDAVLLGMGERYDVAVDLGEAAAARIIAVPLGKRRRAVALLRTARRPRPGRRSRGAIPDARAHRVLRGPTRCRGGRRGPLSAHLAPPTRIRGALHVEAGRRHSPGRRAAARSPRPGGAPRLREPHSHAPPVAPPRTFLPHWARGARKDTITVLPRRTTSVELVADNPGRWALHCHNVYHQEAGMMRELRVG